MYKYSYLVTWHINHNKSVALTGRNRTGPTCSVGRPTAHAPGRWRADSPRTPRPAGPTAGSVPTPLSYGPGPAGPHACSVTDDDDRRQPAKQYWPIRRASNNYDNEYDYYDDDQVYCCYCYYYWNDSVNWNWFLTTTFLCHCPIKSVKAVKELRPGKTNHWTFPDPPYEGTSCCLCRLSSDNTYHGRQRQGHYILPLKFINFSFLFRQHGWKTSHGISTKLGQKCCQFTNAPPKKN